jgi:hypothetical protein
MESVEEKCGIILVLACGVVGLVSAFMLSGLGVCGFDLTSGMIWFVLL